MSKIVVKKISVLFLVEKYIKIEDKKVDKIIK